MPCRDAVIGDAVMPCEFVGPGHQVVCMRDVGSMGDDMMSHIYIYIDLLICALKWFLFSGHSTLSPHRQDVLSCK